MVAPKQFVKKVISLIFLSIITTLFLLTFVFAAPSVTQIIPATDTSFNVSQSIEVGATVSGGTISAVLANITLPNNTINQISLSLASGSKYNSSYIVPNISGVFNVTIIANDSTGDVNNTEKVSFIADLVDPNNINGIRVWYDATDNSTLFTDDSCSTRVSSDNQEVYCWADKSINRHNATNVSGKGRPQFLTNKFNGHSVLNFSKSEQDSLRHTLASQYTSDFTIFAVIQSQGNPATYDSFFSNGEPATTDHFQIDYTNDSGAHSFRYGASTKFSFETYNNDIKLYSVTHDGSFVRLYNEGNEVNNGSTTEGRVFEHYRVNQNRNGNQHHYSYTSEIILYDRVLDKCEHEQVNIYLGNRFGKDFFGISDNYDHGAPYSNDINGIGEFYSSCTTTKEFTSAQSSITTVSSLSSLDLSDSLTFAHDDKGFTLVSEAPTNYSNRINQSWRVDEDNEVGNVSVSFDLSSTGISATSSEFALLIDSDNNFSDATVHTVGYSISGNTVTFTQINFSHGEYFSLAVNEKAPDILFVDPTPANDSVRKWDNLFVNISSNASRDHHYSFVDFGGSLAFWMRFDDRNESGHPTDLASSLNGSLVGGTNINSSGVFGDAAHFDGVNDYVDLPDFDFDFGAGFSSCSWMYWNSFTESWSRIFDFAQGQADDNVLFAHHGTTNDLTFEVYNGGSGGNQVTASSVLFTNLWQHICVTLDSSGFAILYVNGTQVVNGSSNVPSDVVRNNAYLGRSNWAGDGYLDGSMDEFLLFNRTLEPSEISSLYNATATQYSHNFTSLSEGNHSYIGYAVSANGQMNQTETRNIVIKDVPDILFVSPTPNNSDVIAVDNFIVNISSDSLRHGHYTFVDFDNTLVSWLRMDDVNSSGAPVDIANGYDGSLRGNALINATGRFGRAAHFDGSGDFINLVPSSTLIPDPTTWSISTWFNANSISSGSLGSRIVTVTNASTLSALSLALGSNNQVQFFYRDESGSGITQNVTSISTNEWHHFAVTYNASVYRVYIDGSLNKSFVDGVSTISTHLARIGVNPAGNNNYFNGEVDEVIFFNRSLSLDEVLSLYNSSENPYSSSFTSLEDGNHSFTGHVVGTNGAKNQTEMRNVTVNAVPLVYFVHPTPDNATIISKDSFVMNISSDSLGLHHYTFANLDNSLNLWLRMDDVNASADPTDLSPYSNHGSLVSNAFINDTGVFGDGLHLDGSTDYIEIADSESLKIGSGDYTYSLWFYSREVPSSNKQLICKRVNGAGNYESQIQPGGIIKTYSGDTGGGSSTMDSSTIISANTWYHLLITRNNSVMYMYVNGVLENQTTASHDVSSTSNLFIGRDAPNNDENFNGHIDEVILFNRSFSGNEVLSLYNASATQYQNNFSSLASGNHTYIGYAVNSIGKKNQTKTRLLTIDTILPTGTLLTPNNNTLTSTPSQNLTVNVSDNIGVSNVTLYIYNESNVLVNKTTVLVSLVKAVIGVVYTFVDGVYTWFYQLIDSAGNLVTSENRTLTVDTTPPSVTELIPVLGSEFNHTEPIQIGANVSDTNGVGTAIGEVKLPNGTRMNFTLSDQAGDFFNQSFTQTLIGLHNLTIIANDSVNNINQSMNNSFRRTTGEVVDFIGFDYQPLNISINITGNASGILNLSITVFDLYPFSTITITGLNRTASTDILLFLSNASGDTDEGFNQTFVIDTSRLVYDNLTAIVNMTGDNLFQCSDVNQTSLGCLEIYSQIASDTDDTYALGLSAGSYVFGTAFSGPDDIGDATLYKDNPNNNYGTNTQMRVGRQGTSGNKINRVAIRFNTSNIPERAVVSQAQLRLYFYNIPSGDTDDAVAIGAHRVQQSPERNWGENSVTWNSYNGTSWSSAGGDFNSSASAIMNLSSSEEDEYVYWNVTSDVQAFVENQSVNYGWILKAEDESSGKTRRYFRTKEHSTESQRPALIVNYSITNFVPTLNNTILNSTGTNSVNDNLTLHLNNVSDQDNDSVTNITVWYKNNNSLTALYLPFEGNTNETDYVVDYSGHNQSTDVNGANWYRMGGRVGGMYEFDGVDDNIEIAFNQTLNITTAITLEAWVKTKDTNHPGGEPTVIGKFGTGSERSFFLGIDDDGGDSDDWVFILSSSCSSNDGLINVNNAVDNAEWQHVVGTWNGSEMQLYKNGELIGTDSFTGPICSSSLPIQIGESPKEEGLEGFIDEVKIYNFSLSADQVYQNYVSSLDPHHIDVISMSETSSGDFWHACTTPNDGFDDGLETCSNTVTISDDSESPQVTLVSAAPSSTFSLSAIVNISASVTDGGSISAVLANITLPNGTIDQFTLLHTSGDYYNITYPVPNLAGNYTVRIIANDSSNNVNSSETTTFEVQNDIPDSSAATINGGNDITLSSGVNTSVVGKVTVTDLNGYADVSNVTGFLFLSEENVTAADNNRNHYTSSCSNNGDGSGNVVSFNCTFNVSHYAIPTDSGSNKSNYNWTFIAVPKDPRNTGSNDSDMVEMNTLAAFTITPSVVSFGELGLGANTTNVNKEINVTNLGNVGLDVLLSGTNLSCGSGSISVTYLEYEDDPFSYGSGTDLLGSNVELDLDAAFGNESVTQPLQTTYYGLGVPAIAVGGGCSGSIVITGVADPHSD